MYRHLTNEELQKQIEISPTLERLDEMLRRIRAGDMFFAPRMERSSL